MASSRVDFNMSARFCEQNTIAVIGTVTASAVTSGSGCLCFTMINVHAQPLNARRSLQMG